MFKPFRSHSRTNKSKQNNHKGQSTLEYIILVTAVVAVLLIFLAPGEGGFRSYFNKSLVSVSDGIDTMSNRFKTSRPLPKKE